MDQLHGADPETTTDAYPVEAATQVALRETIGRRLHEYRRDLDWTMAQLAGRSGVSRAMLSKIENAQTTPALETLVRLGDALSVPVTAFFRGLADEQDMLHIKAGRGLDIQHRGDSAGRSYQSLGRLRFPHDRLEPTLVYIDRDEGTFPLFQHNGSEMIYIIAGSLDYTYGQREIRLEPGDSLLLLGEVPHGPSKLRDLPIQMLSVKAVNTQS